MLFSCLHITYSDRFDPSRIVQDNVLDLVVPEDLRIGKMLDLFRIDEVRAEILTPVYHIHLAANAREIDSLRTSGIATAHDGHILIAIEVAIAGGAIGKPLALQVHAFKLRKLERLCARSDDDRTRIEHACVGVDPEFFTSFAMRQALGLLAQEFDTEALSLLLHSHCDIEAIHSPAKAGVVLQLIDRRELATRNELLEHDAAKAGTRRIERSGHASRTSAHYHNIGDARFFIFVRWRICA